MIVMRYFKSRLIFMMKIIDWLFFVNNQYIIGPNTEIILCRNICFCSQLQVTSQWLTTDQKEVCLSTNPEVGLTLYLTLQLGSHMTTSKGGSKHKNWCMARVLSFLIRYFSNYYTLHRSDLAARAAPLDPRLTSH